MESSIFVQAAELAASIALGVCLGFVYDVFRLPRGFIPGAGFVFDILFCLIAAGGIFVLGMCCGGTVRFYMPLASFLGGAVYWVSFGRLFRPLLGKLESLLAKVRRALKNQCKKLIKNLKNIFSRAKKRFRITKYSKDDKLGVGMSNSGVRRARRKGYYDENSRSIHHAEVYYPGNTDILSPDHK